MSEDLTPTTEAPTITTDTEPRPESSSNVPQQAETPSEESPHSESSPVEPRENMVFCSVCGSEIAKSAKVCPHCGAKNKGSTPWYKRGWFIVLCILLIVLLGLNHIRPKGSGTQPPKPQSPAASTSLSTPSLQSSDKNGFDSTESINVSYGGITFQIPSYYERSADDPDHYLASEGFRDAAFIQFKADEIRNITTGQFETVIENMVTEMMLDDSFELIGSVAKRSVADSYALSYSIRFSNDKGSGNGRFVAIYSKNVSTFIIILFIQDDKAKNDYSLDFQRILDAAVAEETSHGKNDKIDADFRATMDSYEAFFDEYIAFMQKYTSNPNNALSMMNDYLNFMNRYSEVMKKMNSIDTSNLSNEDMAYYLEVTNRITQKLLKVAS